MHEKLKNDTSNTLVNCSPPKSDTTLNQTVDMSYLMHRTESILRYPIRPYGSPADATATLRGNAEPGGGGCAALSVALRSGGAMASARLSPRRAERTDRSHNSKSKKNDEEIRAIEDAMGWGPKSDCLQEKGDEKMEREIICRRCRCS